MSEDFISKRGFIEIDGVRVYAPKDHFPVWGKYKDEDGNTVMVLSFFFKKIISLSLSIIQRQLIKKKSPSLRSGGLRVLL